MLVKMLTCHSGPTMVLVAGKVYDLPEGMARRFIAATPPEAMAVTPARQQPFQPNPRYPLSSAPPEYKNGETEAGGRGAVNRESEAGGENSEKGKTVETAVVQTQENTAMRVKKPIPRKPVPTTPSA